MFAGAYICSAQSLLPTPNSHRVSSIELASKSAKPVVETFYSLCPYSLNLNIMPIRGMDKLYKLIHSLFQVQSRQIGRVIFNIVASYLDLTGSSFF